jgi:hypothetical protein
VIDVPFFLRDAPLAPVTPNNSGATHELVKLGYGFRLSAALERDPSARVFGDARFIGSFPCGLGFCLDVGMFLRVPPPDRLRLIGV